MVNLKSVAGSTGSKSSMIRLMLIVVAAIVLFALVAYYNSRSSKQRNEGFSASTSPVAAAAAVQQQPHAASAPMPAKKSTMAAPSPAADASPMGVEPFGNDQYRAVGSDPAVGSSVSDPFPQDRLKPEDLLPRDAANSLWAQMNPAGQGDVKDQNFLTAGYHVGFDTQGSSLRNASHDIRSSPPNPRYNVSIWSQSTIEPDLNRRPLE